VPRYAAERVILAPRDEVWAFLAEPYNLGDWWPGVSGVKPDRRGLAPGARWTIVGSDRPTLLRRPDAAGTLLVLEVVPMRRIAFQAVAQRVDAELELQEIAEGRTEVSLVVEAPFLAIRRSFPGQALARLYDLVQTSADV
jgi:uncharacterized protein YndB with AHSA1/START domain